MKTLLIEDDPQFVKIVEAAVDTLPTELIHVGTGKAGVRRAAQGDIGLCIVDGVLPDHQGVRVIQDIKAMPPHINPKIVFLSAFFKDVRTFRKLTALGVDLVLAKPITAADLKQKLSVFMPKVEKPKKPESPEVGFAAALERMKEDYVEKLRLVFAPEFEGLIERAERDDPRSIDEIRMFCHKLRGTAGSYGLAHITEAAARLENGVDYRELSRLLPEMRVFLDLLRNARLSTGKGPVESSEDVGLVTVFRSLLIVSDTPVVYSRISRELAEDKIDIRQASTVTAALRVIVTVEPDLLVVDTAFMDDQYDDVALDVLAGFNTGIPILAFGSAMQALPEGVVSIAMPARRKQLVDALQNPEVQPFRGATVLLCDEHSHVSDRVDEILPPLGVAIERCATADELLARVGAGGPTGAAPGALPDAVVLPDVILMDVEFAKRRGIELAGKIRAEVREEAPPIIFLSAQTTLAERRDAYRVGAAGYLLKPLADEQLSSTVARVLRQQRTARFALELLPRDRLMSLSHPRHTGNLPRTLTGDLMIIR